MRTAQPDTTEPALVTDGLLELVERSPLAIAIVQPDTQEVRYANVAFEALVAPSADASPMRAVSRMLPRAAADTVSALLDEVRLSGAPATDVEVNGADRHGGERTWRVTVWRVGPRDDRQGDLVLQLRDATRETAERRQMTELMTQLREVNARLLTASLRESELATKALAASEAKSTFLNVMSHELRTPLTAIIGYEELLADGIVGPVTQTQRSHLARIRVSADHLLSLIDQVLTLARIDSNSEVVQRDEVGLAELMDWVSTIVSPLAAARHLEFVMDATGGPVKLYTDAVKLRQILVNLLGNAIKFTDHGRVSLHIVVESDRCSFAVRDTGIGIDSMDFDRIFGTFWQVEQRPTRRVGGSGLGLSVSQRLARMLGGEITVESAVGEGSTFSFSLPLDVATTTAAP